MLKQSIFNLPRDKTDLDSSNMGMSDLQYDEIQPLRNISDTDDTNIFGNGEFDFRWHPPASRWWIPNRSYFRIDCSLTKPDGSPLESIDDVAISMAPASCLFSKMNYSINDKTISLISEHCGQVDALMTRLNKSGHWMDTSGANLNFWQSSYDDRRRQVTIDGAAEDALNELEIRNIDTYKQLPQAVQWRAIANYNAADTLAFDADNADPAKNEAAFVFVDTDVATRVRFRNDDGVIDPALTAAGLKPGKIIQYTLDGHLRYSVIKRIESAGPNDANGNNNNRIVITKSTENYGQVLADQAAGADPANGLYTVRAIDSSQPRQVSKFSLIYVPPLSIFGIDHAIPGSSKHQISFTPFSNTVYQKAVVQSRLADKTNTTDNANGDFKFKIENMLFYAATCSGSIIEKDQFFLDLHECRLQKTQITSASRSQYSLDISPSTTAVSIAFQSENITDTRNPISQFTIENNEQDKLKSFYFRYTNLQHPQPLYEMKYDRDDNTDRMVEQWARGQLYSGGYYDPSGETLKQWREERGLFLHFEIPKSGTDRETRLYASCEFDELTGKPFLLVFNHYRKVVVLKYDDMALQEVMLNEV